VILLAAPASLLRRAADLKTMEESQRQSRAARNPIALNNLYYCHPFRLPHSRGNIDSASRGGRLRGL